MSKRKIEIEIPAGKYCNAMDGDCPVWDWDSGWCTLFKNHTPTCEENTGCLKCPECIEKYGVKK